MCETLMALQKIKEDPKLQPKDYGENIPEVKSRYDLLLSKVTYKYKPAESEIC